MVAAGCGCFPSRMGGLDGPLKDSPAPPSGWRAGQGGNSASVAQGSPAQLLLRADQVLLGCNHLPLLAEPRQRGSVVVAVSVELIRRRDRLVRLVRGVPVAGRRGDDDAEQQGRGGRVARVVAAAVALRRGEVVVLRRVDPPLHLAGLRRPALPAVGHFAQLREAYAGEQARQYDCDEGFHSSSLLPSGQGSVLKSPES